MPNLTNGTNLTASIELQQQTGTQVKLHTDEKYIEKKIILSLSAQTATPSFDGGIITGNAENSFTNATTSISNTSGVEVVASATASRTAVLYNGEVDGWVIASDNATASAAINNQALATDTQYITGVNIGASKEFNITVPNGDSTVTLNFSVDANGNVLVT